ncbi:MAG: PspA/IM30 family protein [Chloroflexi bacterium]|nr:PspA/IM30 family protein [Chloroflexota bacterium]
MGILSRMSTLIKAKVSKLLDRAEDPRETLDYSYERQIEMLRDVKRGLVEVTASRRRLELQAAKVRDDGLRLEEQARQALAAGREDLATLALQRKQVATIQVEGLDQQIAQLEQEGQKLTMAEQRLSTKVATFRTQKEVIKAQYAAAEAQVRIGGAVSGISEEMGDVGLAVDRAREKTESMRARADAIDELVATGVLEEVGAGDEVGRELQRISAQQNVELDLQRLRAELAQPPEAKRIEGPQQ